MTVHRTIPFLGLVAALASPAAAAPDFEGGLYVPFDDRPVLSEGEAQVVLNGNVAFSAPDVDLTVTFVGGELVDLRADLELRGAFAAELTATEGGEFSEEIFPPIVALPPIVIDADVSVLPSVFAKVTVEGKAEADMRLSLVQHFVCPVSFAFGPPFDAALLATPAIQSLHADPEVDGLRVDAAVHVELGVHFLVTYQGLPVGGPYFQTGAGLELTVDPFADPWWDLDGGLVVHAGWSDGVAVVFQERLWSESFDAADAGGALPAAPAATRWSRTYDLGASENARSVTPYLDGFAMVGPESAAGGSGWFARLADDGSIAWELGAQVVAGGSSRPVEVQPTAGGDLVAGSNTGIGTGPRVERLAADGTHRWSRVYSQASGASLGLTSLVVREDGGYVFSGRVLQPPTNLPLVVFLDPAGNVEEALKLDFGGAVSFAAFVEVAPAADGGWILSGWADYDDSATQVPPTIDSRNGLVCKLDAARELVFARVVGGPGYDQLFTVAEAADGAVCAGGELKSGNPYVPWILCLEPDGGTRWSATYGDGNQTGNDAVTGLEAVPGGGFVATGFTALADQRDAVLFFVDARGMPVWWKSLAGPDLDEPVELRWTGDGAVFCGVTRSLDAASANPLSDMWVARTSVDGMLHFDAATGFDAVNPAAEWEGADPVSVELATTLVPVAVSSAAANLVLFPTAASVTELTE